MSTLQDRIDIGRRVREAMESRFGGARTQVEIAADIAMTPDKLTRSLKGERSFSSSELARVAHLFGADIVYLITGEPDPMRAVFAARHDFDPRTFGYSNDGRDRDGEVRDGVFLAYRQARDWLVTSTVSLPSTPTEVRALLGEDFARDFADLVEERLGIDVVRLPGLTTDYSLTIADQRVILLKTEANWFRSNYSLAHELGHLCLGHHEADASHANNRAETDANAFAAELLLPSQMMRDIDWSNQNPDQVASFLWNAGISTSALRNRLNYLRLSVTNEVNEGLSQSTQRFLNRRDIPDARTRPIGSTNRGLTTVVDPIGTRMQRAAERRVPARLVKALRDGIETGRLNTGTLAWLLDVDADALEVDEPDQPTELSATDAAALLGL